MVSCAVESPQPPLSFRWAFNNSLEIIDLPQSSFERFGHNSTLRYIPHTENDFGAVLCWAANDVGLMKEPCLMNILPEGN